MLELKPPVKTMKLTHHENYMFIWHEKLGQPVPVDFL